MNETIKQIQEILANESLSDLQKIDKIYEAVIPQKGGKGLRLSQEIIRQMEEMRSRGVTLTKIGSRFNLPQGTVRYHLGDMERMKAEQKRIREKRKQNPVKAQAYRDYQKDYQRKVRDRKKAEANKQKYL